MSKEQPLTTTGVQLSEALLKRAKARAKAEDRSVGSLLRVALRAYLDAKEGK